MLSLALVGITPPTKQPSIRPPAFELTVDSIMRGSALTGEPPRGVRWADDGKTLSFFWKSPDDTAPRRYEVNVDGTHLGPAEELASISRTPVMSPDGLSRAYAIGPDIILRTGNGAARLIARSESPVSGLTWMADGNRIAYEAGNQEQLVDLEGNESVLCTVTPGAPTQATPRTADAQPTPETPSQKALSDEEKQLFPGLMSRPSFGGNRRFGRGGGRRFGSSESTPNLELKPNQRAFGVEPSPDGIHAAVPVEETDGESRSTTVPSYITPSGYTEEINGYPKVGDVHSEMKLAITSKNAKAVWLAPPAVLGTRAYSIRRSFWSTDGKTLIADLDSNDHKDRVVVKVDPDTGATTPIFSDHVDTWLGGPGGNVLGWLPDHRRVYLESERDGWAHLYTVDTMSGETKQLTSGEFEVSEPHLSKDGTRFYFVSSEGSPFRRHLDSVSVDGGARTRLLPPEKTDTLDGDTQIFYSPDESHAAYLRSWVNHPPELYIGSLAPNGSEIKITESPSKEWLSYPWMKPDLVMIPASDGVKVPANFYKPAHFHAGGPAVIFVHGAGYLQNVHDWWKSPYYLEYMFHNLLASRGVAVLDIDYRASAGYGRKWRTAVYRFMGGRDLDDQVDGAAWLVKAKGVDPKRIGIYGGSYGGFLTLMAMFTKPGVFAAGAALRPVSDWANYNDGYTSDILNLPQDDQEAYRRSSPIFHAEGLTGALLICHGVVDTNVHYQDTVRLVQRLIDLRKENWSVAFYPLENHGFTRASSWADEYKRIYKLFQENLKF